MAEKKKFSASELTPEVTAETIEAARNWRPKDVHFSATDYYKRHGAAPPGHKVYYRGKVINDKGEDERAYMAPNDPNRLPKPKGWA
jgi:hypothetical protein